MDKVWIFSKNNWGKYSQWTQTKSTPSFQVLICNTIKSVNCLTKSGSKIAPNIFIHAQASSLTHSLLYSYICSFLLWGCWSYHYISHIFNQKSDTNIIYNDPTLHFIFMSELKWLPYQPSRFCFFLGHTPLRKDINNVDQFKFYI